MQKTIITFVFKKKTAVRIQVILHWLLICAGLTVSSGCTPKPMIPFATDSPPMVLVPASMAGITDHRARFREIFCAITEERGLDLPDYLPCEKALTRLANEPSPTGKPIDLAAELPLKVLVVFGVGMKCFQNYLDLQMTVIEHLALFGCEIIYLEVEALSSGMRNANIIRDAIMAMPPAEHGEKVVLMGYSKGATDILEAVVNFPELHQKVAAVVSVAGSIGGSPLANTATQSTLNLLRYFPKAECDTGDEGALESLRTDVREKWMASHTLPTSIRYYSVVTYPDPDHMSSILKKSHKKLSQVDSRNDSQVIFYDQLIPGSVLIGYLNADHWAVAVPINRTHPFIASAFVDKNAFPREVLMEAIVRFVEEDLNSR